MTFFWPTGYPNFCTAFLLFISAPEALVYYWPITLGVVVLGVLAICGFVREGKKS